MAGAITKYVDVVFDRDYKQVAPSVYRYDHGIALRIRGVPTNVVWQCHFSCRGNDHSIPSIATIEGNAVVGVIPDIILMQPREVICYLYYEDNYFGRTVYEIFIPVQGRARPASSSYTPQQIDTYDQLVAMLHSLIDEVESMNPVTQPTIAPDYDDLTSNDFPFHAGFYCWHNDILYRAIVDIPASESWTAAHWEAASMGNDLAARIDSLEGALGNTAHKKTSGDYTWEIGKIITVNGNENTGAGFATTGPVPAADVPSIINTTGDVGYNSKATVFYLSEYDQNGNWISPRHTLIDGEPYTFSANCAAYRITYGYQAAAGVTMTQAILAEYFSASTLEEGATKSEVQAIASGIDGTNALINVIHGFVNYGYDTPANLAPNVTSQDEKAVGIQRNGTTVILNGTNNTSNNKNIILRLNGSVTRTTSGATLEGWEGVDLKPGQKYTFTSKLIEGTIADENGDPVSYMQIGAIAAGTRTSVGTYTFSGNTYERTFTAEEGVSYVFTVTAKVGYSYTNAKAMITLSESSGSGGGSVSPYIQAEADRVAEKVRDVQTGKTLTFIACSDLHYNADDANVQSALTDMRDGMKAIAQQVHLDFYACFGDIIYRLSNGGATSFDKGKTEIIAVTKLLNDAFGLAPQIRIVGNHDPNCEGTTGYFTPDQLNSFVGIYSNMLEKAESMPNQGVGYHDFDRQKMRVIVINTSYYESAPTQGKTRYYLGPAQTQIMCQMMDLSAKADADEWQIMIFAHIVLDDAGNPQAIGRYSAAINAYVDGTEWSSQGYSYNFSGKNAASLAVYVNGHAHKYRVKNTRHMNASGEVQRVLPLPQLYVPNALPDRDEESMDGVTYTKTAKTAESTAFQVITIDPESKTVYAHHWGAGIDMILHYDPTTENSFSTDLTSPTWASNDAEIATVSGGAVTPVAEGYTIIWAKSEADNCIECWNFHSVV